MDERSMTGPQETAPQAPDAKGTFVPKLTKGREALEREMEEYESLAQEVPFEETALKQAHEKRIALARRRMEVFEARHDNTGALKGEYLGQELKTIFDEKDQTLDAEGRIEKNPALERVQLLFVNLGELDRINQEGDHHSGDRALQALKERIEMTIQSELASLGEKMTEAYSIYRSGGSKFSVKLEGVSENIAEAIRLKLNTTLDISSILPGKEAAPLAASRIGLQEVQDVLNQLPDEEKKQLAEDPSVSRMMIGTAYEMLNQLNDKRETETRLERLVEKMLSGDEAGAKAFYTKYQARALTPMFSERADRMLSYEEIKEKLTEAGALNGKAWADKKAEIALREARRQFEGRRLAQRNTERKISEVAAKTYIQFQESAITETHSRYLKQRESVFQMPEPTEGKKEIEKLVEEKRQAEERLLGKECEEKGSLDADCQAVEATSLNLEYEKAIRDTMTGLKQRGPLFQTIENSLENNESVSTVYIDMAFLKYFDKEGGRETGNLAILKAGEILDKISARFKETGKRVEAYRIGGDEFAFSIAGEDEAFLKEVLSELLEAQTAAGAVPLQGEAPIGMYADQALQFNYGVFHTENKESMKAVLKENGLALEHEGTEKENNELAEYMLRFADKQLEIQKAVKRLQILLEESLDTDDMTSGKYAQLVKYSEKAIFGAAGKEKLAAWREKMFGMDARIRGAKTEAERETLAGERFRLLTEIDAEATEFALTQIRAKGEKSENYEQSVDKIIEEHVRDKFLEQKISSLEAEISSLKADILREKEVNAELQEENISLKGRIAHLEAEKNQLSELREKIRG